MAQILVSSAMVALICFYTFKTNVLLTRDCAKSRRAKKRHRENSRNSSFSRRSAPALDDVNGILVGPVGESAIITKRIVIHIRIVS